MTLAVRFSFVSSTSPSNMMFLFLFCSGSYLLLVTFDWVRVSLLEIFLLWVAGMLCVTWQQMRKCDLHCLICF